MASVSKANKKANPMRTRTDKVRMGPLNLTQLTTLLEKSTPKNKDKIKRYILKKYGQQSIDSVTE